jgi:tyrosyl-tRNA synthetase
MNLKEKSMLLKRNSEEILNEKSLQGILKKKNLTVYCGYEPSGPLHLGHLVTILKLLDFQKAGIKPIVLLANWHAWLNQKGDWKSIDKEAKNWEGGMKAMGLKAKFITGTSFQREEKYIDDVMTLALNITVTRGIRSMQTVARNIEHAKISQIIYPLMQIVDIKHINPDFVTSGMDQRKIHVLGIESLSKIGFKKKPIFVHTGIITSLRGPGNKMSSSIPDSMITIQDTKSQIERKIKKAHCVSGQTSKNPILEITKLLLFPKFETLTICRDDKHGGDLTYKEYKNLEQDFQSKKLHPLDLKNTVSKYLEKLIAPIRKAMS